MNDKTETQLVLVETVSMFRIRYVVEVPVGIDDYGNDKSLWALDTVTSDEALEFSQLHLGETITSHRVIKKDEALAMILVDSPYAEFWNEELKVKNFITPFKPELTELDATE